MEDMPSDHRMTATEADPRFMVYFDGLFDCLTVSEFQQHTWHIAYAGPLTSAEAIAVASNSLTLDRLTHEPIFEQSPGWFSDILAHAFTPDPADERYCVTIPAYPGGIRCCHHARYHRYAPERLRTAPARIEMRCSSGILIDEHQPRCTETAAMIINNRAYCAPCGAAIGIVLPAVRRSLS